MVATQWSVDTLDKEINFSNKCMSVMNKPVNNI